MRNLAHPRPRSARPETRALLSFGHLPWGPFDRPLSFGAFGAGFRRPLAGVSAPIDVRETDEEIVVSAEVPGVDPKDLQLEILDDVFTIVGEKKEEEARADERGSYTERAYGSFRREIRLSSPVDAAQAEAVHKDGVVTVRLPKAETARPRRIEVRSS